MRTIPLVLLFVLPLALASGPASAVPADVDLAAAQEALDALEEALKRSRTPTVDVLAALDDVAAAWHGLRGPPPPVLRLVPDDAGDAEREAIEAENARAQADHRKRFAAFEKDEAKWRDRAAARLVKALAWRRPAREGRRLREEVAIRAAKILGETGRKELWKDVRTALLTRVFRAKVEVSPRYLESVFEAMARLGDPAALAWMAEEYVHTRSSPPREVDRLLAAQRAFVLFDVRTVPGAMRHAIVRKMVTQYQTTEAIARQNANDAGTLAVRRFWDRIRTGVIAAVQHLSGTPRNEDGEALATMLEFQAWFREHKRVGRPPWTDLESPE